MHYIILSCIFLSSSQIIIAIVGALISDITTVMSPAPQHKGVVQNCAKAPCGVQNGARAAEMSVTQLLIGNTRDILMFVDNCLFVIGKGQQVSKAVGIPGLLGKHFVCF